jgi:hypothetical protein
VRYAFADGALDYAVSLGEPLCRTNND